MESNNIQEYRCIYCNYAFTTYISKTSHEEKGKCKDKKYICNKCNARFTTPAGLRGCARKNRPVGSDSKNRFP